MSSSSQSDRDRVLRLDPQDNVATVLVPLKRGFELRLGERGLRVRDDIPPGHKVALSSIGTGSKVIKYGFPIGTAISEISPGEHVHDHNLSSDYFGDPPDSRKSL